MTGGDIWWSYWYFHLPNYVLAALMYTMFGRFMLSYIIPPDSPNYIWRWFRRLTDPVLAMVGFITPAFVHPRYLPLAGMFWLAAARLGFYVVLFRFGLAPQLGGAAVGG